MWSAAAEPPLGPWVPFSLQENHSTKGKKRLVKSCNMQIKNFIKSNTAYLGWRDTLTELTSTILSKQRILHYFTEKLLQRTQSLPLKWIMRHCIYVIRSCGCKIRIEHIIINNFIVLYQNRNILCLWHTQNVVMLSFLTSFLTYESFLQSLNADSYKHSHNKNTVTEWNRLSREH